MTGIARALALTTALVTVPLLAHAESWTLSNDDSRVAFGSVKKNTVGEVHGFTGLSGSVDASGKVMVEIDLTSVETNIDIRNARMVEHVFGKDNPTATLTAQLDAKALGKMKPGDTASVDVEGTLAIAGKDVAVETTMFVARLTDGRAMVTTDGMIMLSMADLGFTGGIDKLMEIAKLPGITQVSPVTMRLIFDRDTGEAKASGAKKAVEEAPKEEAVKVAAASTGDVKKGKKVFKKCKACHVVNKEKNRVGPHLVNIVGRTAGSVEGFKYSKAMAGAGLDWTVENLSAYLAKPKDFLPGNKMAFAGLRKESQIADVIAYLESEAK